MAFYAVILDAGSGGTRAFMYRITPRNAAAGIAGQVAVIPSNRDDLNKNFGIHKVERREGIRPYLQGILRAVVEVLDALPAPPAPAPPLDRRLYLLATGGVRDLDTDRRQALFGWVTSYIRGSGFVTPAYTVISGTDEAKYGWIAANYSQGRDFDAGYVEMGGASAQIAVPMAAGNVATARGVAEALNAENMEALVIRRGWEMENLEAVVSMWAGEANRAAVAHQWGGAARLAMAERELNLGNQAKVEAVGAHVFFSASYRLGAELGYQTYKEVMFGPDLTPQEASEILDPIDANIFYDPSQRQGYVKRDGARVIAGKQVEPGARPKLARTTYLVMNALRTLFPERYQNVAKDLDEVEGLDFLGAANFWWSMNQAAPHGPLTLHAFAVAVRNSSNLSNEAFRQGKTLDQIKKAENDVFKSIWALNTLQSAFGIPLNNPQREITFTPYNGAGAVNGRFSWTLGKAVLLADEALGNLSPLLLLN